MVWTYPCTTAPLLPPPLALLAAVAWATLRGFVALKILKNPGIGVAGVAVAGAPFNGVFNVIPLGAGAERGAPACPCEAEKGLLVWTLPPPIEWPPLVWSS